MGLSGVLSKGVVGQYSRSIGQAEVPVHDMVSAVLVAVVTRCLEEVRHPDTTYCLPPASLGLTYRRARHHLPPSPP